MSKKSKRVVVITQNATLMKEAMGAIKVYRKVCVSCGVGVRAFARNKRTCPRCGGALRAATNEECATDQPS